MAESASTNDLNPIDPTHLAVLLTFTALIVGHLTQDQAGALTAVLGFATTITPHLPRGGR